MSPHDNNLARYRWHTGARLRPVHRDERLPTLFRDVGPVALQRYLAAGLERLAGPQTPLLYMRTARFVEPFIDYAETGRIAFLAPHGVGPWHSGIDEVYVARASASPVPQTLAYVPASADFDAVTRAGAACTSQLRELLGGREYDQRVEHDRHHLHARNTAAARSERRAQPLRRALQSQDTQRRRNARRLLTDAGLDDQALCASWHHLPAETRHRVDAALERIDLRTIGEPHA